MLNLLVNLEEGYVAVERSVDEMAGYVQEVVQEVLDGKAGTEVSMTKGIEELTEKGKDLENWEEASNEFLNEVLKLQDQGVKGRIMMWSVEDTMDVNLMFIEG